MTVRRIKKLRSCLAAIVLGFTLLPATAPAGGALAETTRVHPQGAGHGIQILDVEASESTLDVVFLNHPLLSQAKLGIDPAIERLAFEPGENRGVSRILLSPVNAGMPIEARPAGDSTVVLSGHSVSFIDADGAARAPIDLSAVLGIEAGRLVGAKLAGTADGGAAVAVVPRPGVLEIAKLLADGRLSWRRQVEDPGAKLGALGLWGLPDGGVLALVDVNLPEAMNSPDAGLSGEPGRFNETRLLNFGRGGLLRWSRLLSAQRLGPSGLPAGDTLALHRPGYAASREHGALILFRRTSYDETRRGTYVLPIAEGAEPINLDRALADAGVRNIAAAAPGAAGRIYVLGMLKTAVSRRSAEFIAELGPAGALSWIRLLPGEPISQSLGFARVGAYFVLVSTVFDSDRPAVTFETLDESMPVYEEIELARAQEKEKERRRDAAEQQGEAMKNQLLSNLLGDDAGNVENMSQEELQQRIQDKAKEMTRGMEKMLGKSLEELEAMTDAEREAYVRNRQAGGQLTEGMEQQVPGLTPDMLTGQAPGQTVIPTPGQQDAAEPQSTIRAPEPRVAVLPPPAPDAGFPDGSEALPVDADFGASIHYDNPDGRRLTLVVFDTGSRSVLHQARYDGPIDERYDLREFDADVADLLIEIIDDERSRVVRRMRPAYAGG